MLIDLKILEVSSFLMNSLTGYDSGYNRICELDLQLNIKSHRIELLKFLNSWGCRQFAHKDHRETSNRIAKWYRKYGDLIPASNKRLLKMEDNEIKKIAPLFDQLKSVKASINKQQIIKRIGAVGAAKILFAIRRHIFSPWDNSTIERGKNEEAYTKDGNGYVAYLIDVKKHLQYLEQDCIKRKFSINEMPTKLDRPYVTLVKLIDECLFLKYTRNIDVKELIYIANKSGRNIL